MTTFVLYATLAVNLFLCVQCPCSFHKMCLGLKVHQPFPFSIMLIFRAILFLFIILLQFSSFKPILVLVGSELFSLFLSSQRKIDGDEDETLLTCIQCEHKCKLTNM